MTYLVTGGAGFIGSNTVKKLLALGGDVIVYDNLHRSGSKNNLKWLKNLGRFKFIQADIRDEKKLNDVFQKYNVNVCIHLAAQVAVTTSVEDPRADFEINAYGTFNLLESIRKYSPHTIVINASTNKVYGEMDFHNIVLHKNKYAYEHLNKGVNEKTPLDFHSPYGCSKGTADQYVIDYGRIYNLRTVNFRQSCIYGYRQFGIEDQGWVAWFIIAAILGKKIKIYGDGKQVRDILFVDDLVDSYLKAIEEIDIVSGENFNIGGGPANQLSLLELISFLKNRQKGKLDISYTDWRPGDQKIFVSDISKAQKKLKWYPKVNIQEGLTKLYTWVEENRELFC